jgi:hypothetical protein
MAMIDVRFRFERETKGALRYAEIDDKGEVIEQAWAKVGTMYLRKSAFERGEQYPAALAVRIETSGEAVALLA